jgi:hypothetical protein
MQEKIDASGFDFAKEFEQALQGSSKSIDRPGSDHVDFAARGGFQHPIELRALVASLRAANASVGIFGDDIPSVMLRGREQFPPLIIDALPIGRYAEIQRNALCPFHLSNSFQDRAARDCCVYHVMIRDYLAAKFMRRHVPNADKIASGVIGPQDVCDGTKPGAFARALELLPNLKPWFALHSSHSVGCKRILPKCYAENSCFLYIGLRPVKVQAFCGFLRNVCAMVFCIARNAASAIGSSHRTRSLPLPPYRLQCASHAGNSIARLSSRGAHTVARVRPSSRLPLASPLGCASNAGRHPGAATIMQPTRGPTKGGAGGGMGENCIARGEPARWNFSRRLPEITLLTVVKL